VLLTMPVSSVDRWGVVSIWLTDTELLPAGIDGHRVVPASSSLPVMSVLYVDGCDVLSSADQHGVLSVLLTVSELTATSVDRQGVVSLSVEEMGVSYVGGQEVSVTMLVCSADRHGVLSLLLTDAELTAICVD